MVLFEDDAGLERAVRPSSPDVASTGAALTPAPSRRRLRPTRMALAASTVVLAAAAVVIPLRLRTVASLGAVSHTLLSHPTLRLVISASGARGARGDSTAITLSSPSGLPLDTRGATANVGITLRQDGVDLADLVVAGGTLYLRLGAETLQRIDGGTGRSVGSLLEFLSRQGPRLHFLHFLAVGGWVRLSPRTAAALSPHLVPGPLAGVGDRISQSEGESLARALAATWDEYASARVHAVSPSETVYSIQVPLRAFLSSLVSDLSGRLGQDGIGTLSSLGRLAERVPASLSVPLTLRAVDGSLVAAEVSYHGTTLQAAISHPGALPLPTGAAPVTPIEARALLSYLRRLSLVRPSAAETGRAESRLRIAASVAGVSARHDGRRLFLLTRGSSRFSLARLGRHRALWRRDAPATGDGMVSFRVSSSGRWVVFTSYVPVLTDCIGVLEVTAPERGSVLGAARRPGVYYFVAGRVAPSACNASLIRQVKTWSRRGFPNLTGVTAQAVRVLGGGSGSSGLSALSGR